MQSNRRSVPNVLAFSLILGSCFAINGCEQKEKVIEIETPAGKIEVERSKGSGEVNVDIDIDKKK